MCDLEQAQQEVINIEDELILSRLWKKNHFEEHVQNHMTHKCKTWNFHPLHSSNLLCSSFECSNLTIFYQDHFQRDIGIKSYSAEIYNFNYEVNEDDSDTSSDEEDYSPRI